MSSERVSRTVGTVGKTVTSKNVWNFGSGARLAVGAAMVLAGTSAATAAPVVVIDTFGDANLSEYTLTKVLDQGAGTSNISFSSPSGALSVGSAGATGAEQVLFLRDDHSLAVGETLLADVSGSFTNWDRDFGIAVGYTETPPGLGNGAAGDVRTSFIEISSRAGNQIASYARNGSGNLTSAVEFRGTDYDGESFNTTDPLSLFITRTSANTFEVGWLQNDTRHVLTNNGTPFQPYTFTDANVPGDAVGFYSDIRTNLASAPVTMDNLRIESIPEPSSLAVLAAGGLLALRRRRQRA